jgi:hypothetical protein
LPIDYEKGVFFFKKKKKRKEEKIMGILRVYFGLRNERVPHSTGVGMECNCAITIG